MRGEDGISVIEVLVVMTVGLVLVFAAVATFESGLISSDRTTRRTASLDDARVAMKRMTDDLRQALTVAPASGQGPAVALTIYTGGTPATHTVRWDCDQPGSAAGSKACVRFDDTLGTSERLIDGLDGSVARTFTIVPPVGNAVSPSVEVDLTAAVSDSAAGGKQREGIGLRTSVTPRNCRDGYFAGATTCGA